MLCFWGDVSIAYRCGSYYQFIEDDIVLRNCTLGIIQCPQFISEHYKSQEQVLNNRVSYQTNQYFEQLSNIISCRTEQILNYFSQSIGYINYFEEEQANQKAIVIRDETIGQEEWDNYL